MLINPVGYVYIPTDRLRSKNKKFKKKKGMFHDRFLVEDECPKCESFYCDCGEENDVGSGKT